MPLSSEALLVLNPVKLSEGGALGPPNESSIEMFGICLLSLSEISF